MRLRPETTIRAAVGSTRRSLDQEIARQPAAERARLAGQYFTRSALRRALLDERDAELRELAGQIIAAGPFSSGKPLARAVLAEVLRYETTAWPRERGGPEPADPRRRALWRILRLSSGKTLGERQLLNILAGSRCPP